MPKLDRTGPEGIGPGRKLGKCSTATHEEKLQKLGKGMGKKRKSEESTGKGKRLKSGININ